MASDLDFVEFIVDQLSGHCEATFKRMFGEFGLYADGKFFGVVCDNQLFVKPTEGGRKFIGEPVEAPPYPGAKPSFLIQGQIEDSDWLGELVMITAGELPDPKKKKPKTSKKKG